MPPRRPRPGVHDRQRCQHRILPRTGGHAAFHDDWGRTYYYLADAIGDALGQVDDVGKCTALSLDCDWQRLPEPKLPCNQAT